MSNSGWKRAFCRAQDIEAEGEKYFEGFFKKSKTVTAATDPVNQDSKIASTGINEKVATIISAESAKKSVSKLTDLGETEEVDVERGGFCQPTGLASFFKDIMDSRPDEGVPDYLVVDPQIDSDLSVVVVKENGMARQICRAWLKNNFLKLGEACKNPDCERRHILDSCSVGTLYKDYSFKGLTAAQRNSIIAQVQSGAAKTVAKNSNVVSTATSAAEKVIKRPEVLPTVSPESVDFSVKTDQTCHQKNSSADSNPEIMKSVSNDCLDSKCYKDSKKCSIEEASDHTVIVTPSSASPLGQPVAENKVKSSALNEKIDSGNKSSATENRLLMKKLRKPWMPLHKQITY
jgi:hypothetical protein